MERNIEIQKLQSQVSKLSKREQFNWGTFVLSFWWLWILIALACWLGWKYYKGVNPFVGIISKIKNL